MDTLRHHFSVQRAHRVIDWLESAHVELRRRDDLA